MSEHDSLYLDTLAGVYNKRYLHEVQKDTITDLITNRVPLSLVWIDIDHFKEINDTHGHMKGDEIIKGFAHFLKRELRKSDTVIRYGGDEFICIMPRTIRRDAEFIYHRILEHCRQKEFSGLHITLSAGISAYPDDGNDYEGLLKTADQALYDAKRSGRDRIGTVRKKTIELPMKVFIDRIEEKETLKRVLNEDTRGITFAVVKGAVGIGKTRLVRAVLSDIRGKEIIWSNCVYFAETVAYHPIKEAIRYRIQRLGAGILQDIPPVYKYELAKLIPDLAAQISEKAVSKTATMDKYRLYEGIRKVIETGDRPKIMVFDNIHWVENESVQVIKYLMRSLQDQPISFIFIYRVEEITELLEDFISSVSREIGVTEIDVRSFTDTETKESVRSIIGDEPGEKLVGYVIRESGGIPFYIEEIARNLSDKQYLAIKENQWIFREPEQAIIPISLEAIEVRKYRSLSERTKEVLAVASAIGWFDIETISHITSYSENDIIALLNDVSRLGMIKYRRDRFEFAEEISRHAIYSKAVEAQKKKQLHESIARRIEAQSKEGDKEIAEVLALHYYRSENTEKGIQCCMTAGDYAQEKYAHQDAVRYYTWALELLEGKQNFVKMRIDCLMKRAEAAHRAGHNDMFEDDCAQALHDAQAIHDDKRINEIRQKKSILQDKESPA